MIRTFQHLKFYPDYFKNALLFVLLLPLTLLAQQDEGKNNGTQMLRLNIGGGIYFSGADFADTYGMSGQIGLGFDYKLKQNWIFGLEGNFIFGSDINDNNIIDVLRTENGFLIGLDGDLYAPTIYLRGYDFQAFAGKIIPFSTSSLSSGLLVKLGIGYIQHKILYNIQQKETLPQISGEYAKGYDRMSSGLKLNQFIGYHYMSNNHLINFIIGFDISEGFTKNRRGYNYDTGMAETESKLDLLYGLRATWILPFYKKGSSDSDW